MMKNRPLKLDRQPALCLKKKIKGQKKQKKKKKKAQHNKKAE